MHTPSPPIGAPILGKHRGFGFVEFDAPEEAAAAIENMHESELFGRIIKCNLANPKAARVQSVWAQAEQRGAMAVAAAAKEASAMDDDEGADAASGPQPAGS